MRNPAIVLSLALLVTRAAAQGAPAAPAARPPIADNSFLIEEAYNQEKGVVQHISVFAHARAGSAWWYTFTQEWPLGGVRHQLSYTLPFAHSGPGAAGIGDVLLNYRYQLVGDPDSRVDVAPRLSLSVPTGNRAKGLGEGGAGVQVMLPLSVMFGRSVVTHSNLGFTAFPESRRDGGVRSSSWTLALGKSVVWHALPRVDFLVEGVWAGTARRSAGSTDWEASTFINPGVRWAHDFTSGLQVVPGVSFPIGVGKSEGEREILLYLSFEHPFSRGP